MSRLVWSALASTFLLTASFSATPAPAAGQPLAAPSKVDFGRDVQPIFEKYCYECHGSDKQMNGFRLDRRHDATRGGTGPMIGPGSAASSRLYLRLIGSHYGRQMPLEGEPPTAAEIETIRRWIDEGAVWPDSASGDPIVAPLDPSAVAAFAALRQGNRTGFLSRVIGDAKLSTLRGPGGATPLMIAALYGDAALVKTLLDAGADPKVANDAGATALHWAAGDLEKVRLLLARGADADARSNDGRTPLVAAAGLRGNLAVVSLLLDHGANPSATSPGNLVVTPVSEAAKQGDEPIIRLLLGRGANISKTGAPALAFAIRSRCDGCVEAIATTLPPLQLTLGMLIGAPPLGHALATRALLDRGADPMAKNAAGFPILVLAAASPSMALDAVRALLARGADIQATGPNGETALEVARRHGNTEVAHALLAAGAREVPVTPPSLAFAPASSAREAVRRSLPLLQRADVTFLQKTGCVSCHNNTQAAQTMALARRHGFAVDEAIAAAQRARIAAYLDSWRERLLQGASIAGDNNTLSAILNGLAAEGYPADATTDAAARFMRVQQRPDGSFLPFSARVPLETSPGKVTVESIRTLERYAPPSERRLAAEATARAAAWLRAWQPQSVQDCVYRLSGLSTVKASQPAVAAAARPLAAAQRPDGGWAQLPTLASDAYATGEALVALLETGAMRSDNPVVRRAVNFLIRTQLADGSWFVARRAVPLQPYTDAGFPHGRDQFISASATHLATQALIYAADGERTSVPAPGTKPR